MEKFDKILELLEKPTLTNEELKFIEQLAQSDEEIKSFVSIYNKLNSLLSGKGHIPTELLASYVLHETEGKFSDKVVSILSAKIKSHLKECNECTVTYNDFFKEYSLIDDHVNRSSREELPPSVEKRISVSLFYKSSALRYAFAAMTFLIVSYFGLYFITSSNVPEYKKNLFQNQNDDSYKTRGRTSPLFQQGLNAIDKGDYSNAIEFLSEDIKEHQNEESIFYTHYIIGITYLKASESDFIGLFKNYDNEKVSLSISNLRQSIDKNDSGNYEGLKLDSYYYLGRAYLLIDDNDSAITSLKKVIEGKGRFLKESSEMINQLEKN
jgi:tetratricopeptide (TPR) repeat protein